LRLGASHVLFVLPLFEMAHGDVLRFRETVDCLHILIATFSERGRGRNRELPLPVQENAYFSCGLKFGHERLLEDAIYAAAPQVHVMPEQSGIVGHDDLSDNEDSNRRGRDQTRPYGDESHRSNRMSSEAQRTRFWKFTRGE
jgi:hypothetical protein